MRGELAFPKSPSGVTPVVGTIGDAARAAVRPAPEPQMAEGTARHPQARVLSQRELGIISVARSGASAPEELGIFRMDIRNATYGVQHALDSILWGADKVAALALLDDAVARRRGAITNLKSVLVANLAESFERMLGKMIDEAASSSGEDCSSARQSRVSAMLRAVTKKMTSSEISAEERSFLRSEYLDFTLERLRIDAAREEAAASLLSDPEFQRLYLVRDRTVGGSADELKAALNTPQLNYLLTELPSEDAIRQRAKELLASGIESDTLRSLAELPVLLQEVLRTESKSCPIYFMK